MVQHVISEQLATGEEISSIIDQIEPVVLNIPRGKLIVALLSMVLILQNPSITPDQLQVGVRDVSRFCCMVLEGSGEVLSAKSVRMN